MTTNPTVSKNLWWWKDHVPPRPTCAQVLESPAVSYWLKDALTSALRRDPVNAIRDAELLVDLLTARVPS